MAVSLFTSNATRSRQFLCASCALKLLLPRIARRNISERFLWKTAEAADKWRDQAQEIRAGKKDSMLKILEDRGYINAIVGDRDEFDKLLTSKRVGVYLGVDPTAVSMHVGHLLPLMALFWMHMYGFFTVTLLGGATGKIGDPTGRLKTRDKQHSSVFKANLVGLHYQMKGLWKNVVSYGRAHGFEEEWARCRAIENNSTWLNKVSIVEFLKLLGHGVRVGPMLTRDTVKTKLNSGDGMSFAEFAYPILQGWDWWHLYNQRGVQIQIGGADQFGNIVAGIDAVKYIARNHDNPEVREGKTEELMQPFGFTVPLLTSSSGEKFGKSAGNAVWLDKEMTSVFALYQFFLRSADADVERYLKLFTFVPLSRISKVMEKHERDPSKRVAQKLLAQEVVHLVHGEEAAKQAQTEHSMFFRSGSRTVVSDSSAGQPSNADNGSATSDKSATEGFASQLLNKHAPQTNWKNAPPASLTLPKSLVYNQSFPRILYAAGLVNSRSEGHRMVSKQGAYVGSAPGQVGGMGDEVKFTPIKTFDPTMPQHFIQDGDLLLLRVGKWKVKVCKIIEDEEFEKAGLDVPGWKEFKETQQLRTEEAGVGVWNPSSMHE